MRFFQLIIMVSMLLSDTHILFACGPFEEEVIFTFYNHPDYPLEQFAKGKLGILQSGYQRKYLVFAYRYLNNIKMSNKEMKMIASLLAPPPDIYAFEYESEEQKAINEWIAERAKISGAPSQPAINTNYSNLADDNYYSFENCYSDAFRNATKTLKDRVRRYGKWQNLIVDWVKTQDQVFSGCSGTAQIPMPSPSWAPPIVRADREYQIAAAYFYNRNYDESRKRFEDITKNNNSPWKSLAHLLVARSLIRKGTTPDKPDKAVLSKAEEKLKQILSDPNLAEVHTSAGRMVMLIESIINPVKRLHNSSKALQKTITETTRQELIDFTFLLERYESYSVPEDSENNFKLDLPPNTRQDEMIDWILTFQMQGKEWLEHSLKRWKETSSLHWLVAAIDKVEANNPRAKELIKAAAKLKTDSPAYHHANYHLLRLMIDRGQRNTARKKLDAILSSKIFIPISSRNQFLYLRSKLARNLHEFFKYSQRKIIAVRYFDDDAIKGKAGFDTDSIETINESLPLQLLVNAVSNKRIQKNLRRQIAIAAFTRSTLLGKNQTTKSLAPKLISLVPEMKKQLQAVRSAPNPSKLKQAALFAILKYPGMRPHVDIGWERPEPHKKINDYRNNWWCDFEEFVAFSDDRVYPPEKKTVVDIAAWLSKNQRRILAHEKRILKSQLYGPNELCKRTIKWAKQNPKDPRIPEALHLAVKSVRFGCRDQYSRQYSKEAFQILHKRFPNSEWAKMTKYYYGD